MANRARDLRFVLFGRDDETGRRVVLDIVEPKQRYARKFYRRFMLMLRRGEAIDFTVGAVDAWPYDQRTITAARAAIAKAGA